MSTGDPHAVHRWVHKPAGAGRKFFDAISPRTLARHRIWRIEISHTAASSGAGRPGQPERKAPTGRPRWTVRRPELHPRAACRAGGVDDEASGAHGPGRAGHVVRSPDGLGHRIGRARRASSRVMARPVRRSGDHGDAHARPLQLILGGASFACASTLSTRFARPRAGDSPRRRPWTTPQLVRVSGTAQRSAARRPRTAGRPGPGCRAIWSSDSRTLAWVPRHSTATAWNRPDASPRHASCSAVSSLIIRLTWPSMSALIRCTVPAAADPLGVDLELAAHGAPLVVLLRCPCACRW